MADAPNVIPEAELLKPRTASQRRTAFGAIGVTSLAGASALLVLVGAARSDPTFAALATPPIAAIVALPITLAYKLGIRASIRRTDDGIVWGPTWSDGVVLALMTVMCAGASFPTVSAMLAASSSDTPRTGVIVTYAFMGIVYLGLIGGIVYAYTRFAYVTVTLGESTISYRNVVERGSIRYDELRRCEFHVGQLRRQRHILLITRHPAPLRIGHEAGHELMVLAGASFPTDRAEDLVARINAKIDATVTTGTTSG